MTGIDRLTRLFESGGGIRLMAHAVCGYPDLSASKRILAAMIAAGADIIEAQLPFSDPSADGPTIVEANHAALRSRSSTASCLEALEALRRETEAPILVMSYLNPILAYGVEEMAERCARSGLDGFIVPDYPDDESEPPLAELLRRVRPRPRAPDRPDDELGAGRAPRRLVGLALALRRASPRSDGEADGAGRSLAGPPVGLEGRDRQVPRGRFRA